METIKDKKGNTTEIKLSWCVDDVIGLAKQEGRHITRKQAGEVLDLALRRHDCNEGINWDVLSIHISEVV